VRQKLLEEVCFEAMKNNFKPLHHFSDGFLRSIIHGMTPYLALPKEILIAQNSVCDKIYLIIRGKVNILTSSRDKFLVTDTIEKDSIVGHFDETDCTYRAMNYCELYCLTLEHYDGCMHYSRNNDESSKLQGKEAKVSASERAKRASCSNTRRGNHMSLRTLRRGHQQMN